jgi:hypothetical protein
MSPGTLHFAWLVESALRGVLAAQLQLNRKRRSNWHRHLFVVY